MRRVSEAVLPVVTAVVLGGVVSAVVITLAGADPILAFSALLEGAFGSLDGLSEVGVKSCPLLLTGLAVALAFRAGVWNIGAEGQLLAGAICTAWAGACLSGWPAWCGLPLVLAGSAVAGGAWAGVAALLKTRRDVNEIIATIMLNFIALGVLSYLVQGPLMETAGAYPQTDALPPEMRLPRLVGGSRVHFGLLIALAVAAFHYVLLFRTVAGYEVRATGANAAAAQLAGIDVRRNVLLAFVLSGAMAGLAGGVEVSAVTYRLYERFSPGYGFTAIAVALLGRLHPGGVVVAAFLFGILEAGSNSMQRAAGVSSVLVSAVQGTVIFTLLAAEYRAARVAKLRG